MAIQSFTVTINGKEEIIEFEDDPPFGEMQKIIKSCIDISDVSHPQVNLQLYQQMILQTVVTKAPFNPKNAVEFAKLSTSSALGILNRLMQALPLETLIAPMITAATGQSSTK
jgi:hypothetical protein|tara:strand:+ start:418 stop:756 length:339 start_codon:yes stop_codon:yes gene_type:complete